MSDARNMKWVNIWTHRPYSPFIMHLAIEATIKGFSKLFPSSITRGGSYWKNGVENCFYVKEELFKTVDDLSKKSLECPDFLYNFFKTA